MEAVPSLSGSIEAGSRSATATTPAPEGTFPRVVDPRAFSPDYLVFYRNLFKFRVTQMNEGMDLSSLSDEQWGLKPLDKCHHISTTCTSKDGPQSFRVRICKTCCQEDSHIELGTYVDQESAILVNDTFEILNHRLDKLIVLRPEDRPHLQYLIAKKYDRSKGRDYACILDLIAERIAAIEGKKRKPTSAAVVVAATAASAAMAMGLPVIPAPVPAPAPGNLKPPLLASNLEATLPPAPIAGAKKGANSTGAAKHHPELSSAGSAAPINTSCTVDALRTSTACGGAAASVHPAAPTPLLKHAKLQRKTVPSAAASAASAAAAGSSYLQQQQRQLEENVRLYAKNAALYEYLIRSAAAGTTAIADGNTVHDLNASSSSSSSSSSSGLDAAAGVAGAAPAVGADEDLYSSRTTLSDATTQEEGGDTDNASTAPSPPISPAKQQQTAANARASSIHPVSIGATSSGPGASTSVQALQELSSVCYQRLLSPSTHRASASSSSSPSFPDSSLHSSSTTSKPPQDKSSLPRYVHHRATAKVDTGTSGGVSASGNDGCSRLNGGSTHYADESAEAEMKSVEDERCVQNNYNNNNNNNNIIINSRHDDRIDSNRSKLESPTQVRTKDVAGSGITARIDDFIEQNLTPRKRAATFSVGGGSGVVDGGVSPFEPVTSRQLQTLSQALDAHTAAATAATAAATAAAAAPEKRSSTSSSSSSSATTTTANLTLLAGLLDEEVDVARSLYELRGGGGGGGGGDNRDDDDRNHANADAVDPVTTKDLLAPTPITYPAAAVATATGGSIPGDGLFPSLGSSAAIAMALSLGTGGLKAGVGLHSSISGAGRIGMDDYIREEDDEELDDDGYEDEDEDYDEDLYDQYGMLRRLSVGNGNNSSADATSLAAAAYFASAAKASRAAGGDVGGAGTAANTAGASHLKLASRMRSNSMPSLDRNEAAWMILGGSTGAFRTRADPLSLALKKYHERGGSASAAASGFVGIYSPEDRKSRIHRFLEKRKRRMWTKKVKYDVRKNFADSRVRVKGRFVKKKEEEGEGEGEEEEERTPDGHTAGSATSGGSGGSGSPSGVEKGLEDSPSSSSNNDSSYNSTTPTSSTGDADADADGRAGGEEDEMEEEGKQEEEEDAGDREGGGEASKDAAEEARKDDEGEKEEEEEEVYLDSGLQESKESSATIAMVPSLQQ